MTTLTTLTDARSALQRLEVPLQARLGGFQFGVNSGALPGNGDEFWGTRPWEYGDDLRDLDLYGTLLSGERQTIVRYGERPVTVTAVIDTSVRLHDGAEQAFGTKYEYACLMAAVAGTHITAHYGNRFGGVWFDGDGDDVATMPAQAGDGTAKALWDSLLHCSAVPGNVLLRCLESVPLVSREPGIVVVISDFLASDGWEGGIEALVRNGYAVWCIRLAAPFELELPIGGVHDVADPVTGQNERHDTNGRRGRERAAAYKAKAHTRQDGTANVIRDAGARLLDLRTDQDWFNPYQEFILGYTAR